jgi:hypothetical protein
MLELNVKNESLRLRTVVLGTALVMVQYLQWQSIRPKSLEHILAELILKKQNGP